MISGIKAKAAVKAVIRIGLRRSIEPSVMISRKRRRFSSLSGAESEGLGFNAPPPKRSYSATNNIPFRIAMPKRVMKPIIDGMLTMPDEIRIANTPPINAKGKLTKISKERPT